MKQSEEGEEGTSPESSKSELSAKISIFGDFNVHHQLWLSSPFTDHPSELAFNFAITHDLKQQVQHPNRIPDRLGKHTQQSSLLGSSDHNLISALFTMLDGDGKYSGALNTFLSNIRNNNPYTPGGMVFISEWGSTRQAANAAFIALMANKLGIDSGTNYGWGKGQIDYIIGTYGRSFVVGYNNGPQKPHHRSRSQIGRAMEWNGMEYGKKETVLRLPHQHRRLVVVAVA
ncbi:Endoglucanase A [Portunus trituberculatus]|uniref:cellulase n=1 Tax=Portunus trituberculatus TaxID=210409 RepID=A0A5B7DDP0_PORTR|nr:Endoglucanase A [Portunus trituberculatus]